MGYEKHNEYTQFCNDLQQKSNVYIELLEFCNPAEQNDKTSSYWICEENTFNEFEAESLKQRYNRLRQASLLIEQPTRS
uniref:Uncharacterized protein n=1 Tax=Ditylenchus dipsaci TaxID=166011 RepID=A0A915D7K4_9BILA